MRKKVEGMEKRELDRRLLSIANLSSLFLSLPSSFSSLSFQIKLKQQLSLLSLLPCRASKGPSGGPVPAAACTPSSAREAGTASRPTASSSRAPRRTERLFFICFSIRGKRREIVSDWEEERDVERAWWRGAPMLEKRARASERSTISGRRLDEKAAIFAALSLLLRQRKQSIQHHDQTLEGFLHALGERGKGRSEERGR